MRKIYPLLALLALVLISCREEENKPLASTGRLTLDIGLIIHESDAGGGLKSAQALEDFKVIVCNADGSEAMVFPTVAVMPDTIELEPGNYYVVAHSDNDLPAAFENPYYYGESGIFTISSNSLQTVVVTCSLANTIVSVVYSESMASRFTAYFTTVANALDSLVFASDETRQGYFRPIPLTVTVSLSFLNPDGSLNFKTLSGSIPAPLPNRHYQVHVNAFIDKGMGSFMVLLDSTQVEMEPLEIGYTPEVQDTVDIPQEGVIPYGGLLITEIMYDPLALTDTEGEWFEIYNNSGQVLNLQNLVLVRDATNRHVINASVELLPGEYLVLSRNLSSTGVTGTYVYGTGITLPNTGAVLEIYNEGPVSDPGALIFSLDYGGASFPSGTGASLSLDPGSLDAAAAVTGTSWCISSSVYSTGDHGTPGLVNDLCQ